MARRTRCFESLEERRLLAAVTTSPAAALIAAPTTAASTSSPAADGAAASNDAASNDAASNDAASNNAASNNAASNNAAWNNATPDTTPGDTSSGEYGAAAAAPSTSDGSYGSYTEYAASGTADYSTSSTSKEYYPANSTPTAPTSPGTDIANLSAQAAAVQVLQSAQASAALSNAPSVVVTPGGAAAAPATVAPVGPVRFDPQDLVARRELAEPTSDNATPASVTDNDAQLVAPVAWAMWGEQRLPVVAAIEADAPTEDREPSSWSDPPRAAAFIAGAIGADWAYVERGVDELFERLERLGDELPSFSAAQHVGECVVLAAGAAAAFEYVRAQFREGGSWQGFIDGGREPWEPRLRRRWFRRRAESRSH